MCLYCWLRHPNSYGDAVTAIILLGGDTDTTAAIVGGLAGATLGEAVIRADWTGRLQDYPRSLPWIRRLGRRLSEQFPVSGKPRSRLGPLGLF